MKNLLSLLLVTVLLITACAEITANNEKTNDEIYNTIESDDTGEIKYGVITGDWFLFPELHELIERTDVAVIGKVTGVSFDIVDKRTGHSPTENKKEEYIAHFGDDVVPWALWELITIYDVDIISTYKSSYAETIQIRIPGGIKDYREEEQLAISRKHDINFVIYHKDYADKFEVGETYLFALTRLPSGHYTPLNPTQGIYCINNPFEKQTSCGVKYGSGYYYKSTNEYGSPLISAYDIISSFGDEAWDTFWTDWQRDNPDWESRIDGAAVAAMLDR
jgi:hypothetical protein